MKCQWFQARVSAYLDDELSDSTMRAVRNHLRGCEACRKDVRAQQALIKASRDLAPPEVPDSLWDAIRAEVRDTEEPREARAPLRGILLGGGLALATAASLALFMGRHSGDTSSTDERAGALSSTAPASLIVTEPMEDEFRREILASERHYNDTLTSLRELVAEEEASWAPERREALAKELSALTPEALRGGGTRSWHPALHDDRFERYRAEIEALESALLAGGPL